MFQNRFLCAAWKGVGGDSGIYWSWFDGRAWAPQQRIAGVGTSVGPSLVDFGQAPPPLLYAFWRGVNEGTNWGEVIGDVGKDVYGIGKAIVTSFGDDNADTANLAAAVAKVRACKTSLCLEVALKYLLEIMAALASAL
jgi:hypothetical protein